MLMIQKGVGHVSPLAWRKDPQGHHMIPYEQA